MWGRSTDGFESPPNLTSPLLSSPARDAIVLGFLLEIAGALGSFQVWGMANQGPEWGPGTQVCNCPALFSAPAPLHHSLTTPPAHGRRCFLLLTRDRSSGRVRHCGYVTVAWETLLVRIEVELLCAATLVFPFLSGSGVCVCLCLSECLCVNVGCMWVYQWFLLLLGC